MIGCICNEISFDIIMITVPKISRDDWQLIDSHSESKLAASN